MSTPSPLSIQRKPLGVYTVTETKSGKTEKPRDLRLYLSDYLTEHADLTAEQLKAIRAEVSKFNSKGLVSKLLKSENLQSTLDFLDRKITSASSRALPSTSASNPPRSLTHAERRKEAVDAANMALLGEDNPGSSTSQIRVTFQTDPASSNRPQTPPVERRTFTEIHEKPSPVSVEEFRSALKKEAKMIAKLDMPFDREVGAWLSNLMQQSFDEACQKYQKREISQEKIRYETYQALKAKITAEKTIKVSGNPEFFHFLLGKAAKSLGFNENMSYQTPLIDYKSQETRNLFEAFHSKEWKADEERSFEIVHLPDTYEKKVRNELSDFFHSDLAKTAFKHLTL